MEGYFYSIIPKNLLPSRIWYLMIEMLAYGVNTFKKLAIYRNHFIELWIEHDGFLRSGIQFKTLGFT